MEQPTVRFPLKPNEHISSGTVVYRDHEGTTEYLIMYRRKTDSYHLAKGTIHEHEPLDYRARMETLEETGYDVLLTDYLGSLKSVFTRDDMIIHKETHYFLAEAVEKVSEGDDEHDEVAFYPFDEAINKLAHNSIFEAEHHVLKLAHKRRFERTL